MDQMTAVAGVTTQEDPKRTKPFPADWLVKSKNTELKIRDKEAQIRSLGGRTPQNQKDLANLYSQRQALDASIASEIVRLRERGGKSPETLRRVKELEGWKDWRKSSSPPSLPKANGSPPKVAEPTVKGAPNPDTNAATPDYQPSWMSDDQYRSFLDSVTVYQGKEDELWYKANKYELPKNSYRLGGPDNAIRISGNLTRNFQRLAAAPFVGLLNGSMQVSQFPKEAFDVGVYYDEKDRRYRPKSHQYMERIGTVANNLLPVPLPEDESAVLGMTIGMVGHGLGSVLSKAFRPIKGASAGMFSDLLATEARFGPDIPGPLQIRVPSVKKGIESVYTIEGAAADRFARGRRAYTDALDAIDGRLTRKEVSAAEAKKLKDTLNRDFVSFKQYLVGERGPGNRTAQTGLGAGVKEIGPRTGGTQTRNYAGLRANLGQPLLIDAEIDRIVSMEKQALAGGHVEKTDGLLATLSKERRKPSEFESATLYARAKQLRQEIDRLDANNAMDPVLRKDLRGKAVQSLDKIVKVVELGKFDWARTGVRLQLDATKSYRTQGLLRRARSEAGRALTPQERKLFSDHATHLDQIQESLRVAPEGAHRTRLLNKQAQIRAQIDTGVSNLGRTKGKSVADGFKAVGKVRSAFELTKSDTMRTLGNHPLLAVKTLFRSIPAVTENNAAKVNRLMRENPLFHRMEQLGLKIEELPTRTDLTSNAVERGVDKIPGLRAVGRVSTTIVNQLRVELMGGFLKKHPMATREQMENYARWINVSTGHGTIDSKHKATVDVVGALFSPRLIKARVEGPGMLLKAMATPNMPDSQKIIEEFGRSVIRTSGVIAIANRMGAEIDNDPSSPNFWKVKIGGQVVDLMGDWRNQAQFVMRVLQSRSKAFEQPKGNMSLGLIASEVGRGFATPQVKSLHDIVRGHDSTGKPYGLNVNTIKVLGEMFTPGVVNEIIKGFREGNPKMGIVRGAGKAAGVSVSADPNAGKNKPRP